MLATAAILTGLAVKLLAANRWGIGGAALLVLLLVIDITVVTVHHLAKH